jgi:ACS family pantothenate transporter-like MFS transporter
MKEDLNLQRNDLNLMTTYWTIGYIVGQLPFQLVMTKIRPSLWLPTLEIAWGLLVMGMAGAQNVETIYTLRFFIGLLEASAYPGIMTLLGNWYTPMELGKRSGIFQASSSAAQMFSGYLQAGLYKDMKGKHGLSGRQWLFLFDGVIGIPIALYGYWAIPDAPTTTQARWLTDADRKMARDRMDAVGRTPPKKLTVNVFLDVFKRWPVYLFSALSITHVLGIRLCSYFNLWLQSTERYSAEEVNMIPTAGYALQSVCTLCYTWVSDGISMRWQVTIFACFASLTGNDHSQYLAVSQHQCYDGELAFDVLCDWCSCTFKCLNQRGMLVFIRAQANCHCRSGNNGLLISSLGTIICV